jgi:hypothetical protein
VPYYNVAAAQINLQTVKWEAADFAAAGDDRLPLGKPAEQWSYGDVEAASRPCDRGKLRLRRPRPPSDGDALRHGLLAGRQVHPPRLEPEPAAVPNIAGIKPEDLVLVAEFCSGGFGSKHDP